MCTNLETGGRTLLRDGTLQGAIIGPECFALYFITVKPTPNAYDDTMSSCGRA